MLKVKLFQFLVFRLSVPLATLAVAQGFFYKETGEQIALLIQEMMRCPGKLGGFHVKVT